MSSSSVSGGTENKHKHMKCRMKGRRGDALDGRSVNGDDDELRASLSQALQGLFNTENHFAGLHNQLQLRVDVLHRLFLDKGHKSI